MVRYRIETFSALTGEPQHVEDLDESMEAHTFCVEPWRAQSVHMVYMITPKGSQLWRAYVGGRCITPHLK